MGMAGVGSLVVLESLKIDSSAATGPATGIGVLAWVKFTADSVTYESREYVGRSNNRPPALTVENFAGYMEDALSRPSVASMGFVEVSNSGYIPRPTPYPSAGCPRFTSNGGNTTVSWEQKPNGKWVRKVVLTQVSAVKEWVTGHNPPAP